MREANGNRQAIVPVLRYRDARRAIEWLEAAFGFTTRFAVPEVGEAVRHAQMQLGQSVIILGSVRPNEPISSPELLGGSTQALCVYVRNVDSHYQQALLAGARVPAPPYDTDFGEREYHVLDLEGRPWIFGTYRPSPS